MPVVELGMPVVEAAEGVRVAVSVDGASNLDAGPSDLDAYDLVVVNSSAGKDSQAMLTHLVELAQRQGVDPCERFVVVHADLGRVEWPGTVELAREQAAAYGLRFEVVGRGEDLLAQVEKRRARLDEQAAEAEAAAEAWRREAGELGPGPEREAVLHLAAAASALAEKKRRTSAWPSGKARYCTSDQKTSQVVKLLTREVAEWRRRTGERRPMRVLNCLGIRADESPDRKKKKKLDRDRASNGRRDVTRWLPIFNWSVDEVWATIRRSGLPYHPAYDAGMPRLSCCLCVLAGRRELVLAARLNPELAAEYVEVEDRTGDSFKPGLSMRTIVTEAAEAATQAGDGGRSYKSDGVEEAMNEKSREVWRITGTDASAPGDATDAKIARGAEAGCELLLNLLEVIESRREFGEEGYSPLITLVVDEYAELFEHDALREQLGALVRMPRSQRPGVAVVVEGRSIDDRGPEGGGCTDNGV